MLSSFYRRLVCRLLIDVWFVVVLVTRYCSSSCCDILFVWGQLDTQDRFAQAKISNYGIQYVEELKLHIL